MKRLLKQGDLIYMNFNTQSGHEQNGRRPALVVSNQTYNRSTQLALVCPITNTDRGFPLHVPLDGRTKTKGFVMCEQVKALDFTARNAQFVEILPDDLVQEVFDILFSIIEIE